MALTLVQLKKIKAVDKIIVHSLENSVYLISVIVNGEEEYLVDKKGRSLRGRNKLELLAQVEGIYTDSTVLRQESPYDEMVGMPPSEASNALEVPIGPATLGPSPTLH